MAEVSSPLRKLGFYCLLVIIFLYYTRLHEALFSYGVNRVLYVLIIPAAAGLALSGGLRRAFSARPVLYWSGFVVWMVLTIPFSVWRGDSLATFAQFARAVYLMLILLAGLPLTWKECRMVLCTIALSGIFNIGQALLQTKTYAHRLGAESTTIGNPNDFAAHLLMVLPLVAFLVIYPLRIPLAGTLTRIAAAATLAGGAYAILSTGSRGALWSLIALFGFLLLRSNLKTRIAALFGAAGIAVIAVALVPAETLARLGKYNAARSSDDTEMSTMLRENLLKESIEATITHPLLGVGVGQFGNFEGRTKTINGKNSVAVAWSNAHNSYTQISADTGIPGFLFYIAGAVSPFLIVMRLRKRLRGRPEFAEISTACYCMMAGWIPYALCVFFVNFGYYFYFPAFAGIAIAIQRVVDHQLEAQQSAESAAPRFAPGFVPAPVSGAARPAVRPVSTASFSAPEPVLQKSVQARDSKRFRFNGYR